MNIAGPASPRIQKYWNETFTKEGGGDLEGLALGVAGDSVRISIYKSCCLRLEARLVESSLSQSLLLFGVCILLGSQPALASKAWGITTHA
jgi:hypothetical protein